MTDAPARSRALFIGAPNVLTNELALTFDLTILPGAQGLPTSDFPAVIFVSGETPLATTRKILRWKRRRCANALFGGVWREGLPTERWDYFLVSDGQAVTHLQHAGVHQRRILVVGEKNAGEFLQGRLQAARRSLLWVEEDVSLKSPSTKHLVTSIPHLLTVGWEITVWSFTADALDERVEVQPLPKPPRAFGMFAPYWFWAAANLRGLRRRMQSGRCEAAVVHTVGGAYLGADIASIQFVNQVWLYRQLELGFHGPKAFLIFLWTIPGACKDWLQFKNRHLRVFLPASDSIATEVRRRAHRHAQVVVLPNSYDETRFNPAARHQWRNRMRAELGYTAAETVFCFASQGHYQRKGFWLAVEALAILKNPMAKLLVIGGYPKSLDALKQRLNASYPGWPHWINFVGMQPAPEKYFAAADAFLFPSYFEAFCLAEIEAGAMGLPLLLTPHHGTEMILRDGENGYALSFIPAEMQATLTRLMEGKLPDFAPSPGRGLERGAYAHALAAIYEGFQRESS